MLTSELAVKGLPVAGSKLDINPVTSLQGVAMYDVEDSDHTCHSGDLTVTGITSTCINYIVHPPTPLIATGRPAIPK